MHIQEMGNHFFQPGNMCKVHFLKKGRTVTFQKLGGLDLERGFSISALLSFGPG